MGVAVVTTVKNEERNIQSFLDTIFNQTYKPDQVVICDGGSTDQTVAVIEEWQKKNPNFVELVTFPGNIAQGRNKAINLAVSEIIAVTDAGQKIDQDWVKEITKPLREDRTVNVVAGFFQPDAQTLFEKVSTSLINQTAEEITDSWLPSSRSIAFRKKVWEKVGGYPEGLTYAGEDTLFDLKIKKAGFSFFFAPKAIVYWRPRPDLKSFYRQFYLYAKGDGQYWPHSVGYGKKIAIYSALLLLFITSFFLSSAFSLLIVLYLFYLFYRARKAYQRSQKLIYWLLAIPLVVVFDIASLLGYVRGIIDWAVNPQLRKQQHAA